MLKTSKIFFRFITWRLKNIPVNYYIIILSIVIGTIAALASVLMKNIVGIIQNFIETGVESKYTYFYLVSPVLGIFLTILFVKFVIRDRVGHGIPRVLYAISQNNGIIKRHNLFSSIIGSALTVGFGGSVGLEGPAVSTGAAYGSNISRLLRLNYTQTLLLIGCGATAAISAIFKTPVAAIVFSLEVLMLDLSLSSLVPLLASSVTGILISYFFLGKETIWAIDYNSSFQFNELIFYILLGVFTGLISVYFTKIFIFIEKIFEKIKRTIYKLALGGVTLGILIWFFPSLYGEGYNTVNECLNGNFNFVFQNVLFSPYYNNVLLASIVLFLIVLLKAFATSCTFGSGGIGGVFAPSLFIGANAGILFALVLNNWLVTPLIPANYALVAMSGMLSGILHGPLTAIFLIADITRGYQLIIPLMITSTISFITTKIFVSNSVYTLQLARRKQLLTHDKDQSAFVRMKVEDLIETNFAVLSPGDTLRKLVDVISGNTRNVFPVVDKSGNLVGVLTLNDVRHVIFKPELYKKTYLRDLMYFPETWVNLDDNIEDIADRIEKDGRFNVPVLKNGKYMGFVSRANVLTEYRKRLREFQMKQ